ncbi:hypothetical protein SAMN02746041_00956 [Desulfacinum hydrothermale DSM 13146]|uniref:Uncharacterized protein n=1 Tax=Desulfacinum hydrothermale DSM 13146 TaxID=1121390 RepID=A0A1W1X9A0_9BACT|nr:hypothetical protein SAMN02746041_00956 [Desulfacinum hydrothermale DSM 13146]
MRAIGITAVVDPSGTIRPPLPPGRTPFLPRTPTARPPPGPPPPQVRAGFYSERRPQKRWKHLRCQLSEAVPTPGGTFPWVPVPGHGTFRSFSHTKTAVCKIPAHAPFSGIFFAHLQIRAGSRPMFRIQTRARTLGDAPSLQPGPTGRTWAVSITGGMAETRLLGRCHKAGGRQ